MKRIKRVLVVNPFGLGDCLFLTPVLRALKESGGVEKTVLLLGSRTQELFQHSPYVDEVIPIDRDLIRSQNVWKNLKFLVNLLFCLRKEKFDALIDVSMSREYSFFSKFLLWIPKRVGFNYHSRGIFQTDKLALPEGYKEKHVAEFYLDLLSPLGLIAGHREMEIFLTDEERKWAGAFLQEMGIQPKRSFIVLAPGGGESWGADARFKRWPAESFSKLLTLLREFLPSEQIVLIGSKAESDLGKGIVKFLDDFNVLNLMGKLSLRQSFSILDQASFVLTNDGGICHASRALNIPLAAIYGPVSPVVYGPYPKSERAVAINRTDLACQPCYKSFRYNSSCQTIECLRELSPVDAAKDIIGSGILNALHSKRGTSFVTD